MKNNLIFLFGLISIACFAQTPVLYVPNNEQVSVLNNETLSLEGLVLDNSQNITFNNTTLFYTNTPVVFTTGESVKRVYEWSNEITSYDGFISFKYDNIDLNNLNSNDLKIATSINGGNYSIVASNSNSATGFVTLTNNVTNFSFKNITLATDELLNVGDFYGINDIVLYPNPASSTFFNIKISKELNGLPSVLVFDELGREILIDVQYSGLGSYKCTPQSVLASGTYIVYIKTDIHFLTRKLIIEK